MNTFHSRTNHQFSFARIPETGEQTAQKHDEGAMERNKNSGRVE